MNRPIKIHKSFSTIRTIATTKPNQHLIIDLAQQWPLTRRNHQHLFLACDSHSCYLYAIAVPDLTAKTMVLALSHIIQFSSFISSVATDMASYFSGEFSTFLASLNILHMKREARKSSQQGAAERHIQLFRSYLTRTLLNGPNGKEDWDLQLSLSVAAFNLLAPYNVSLSRSQLHFGNNYNINLAGRYMIDEDNTATNKFLQKIHSSRLRQKERNLKNTIKPGQFVVKLIPPHDQKIVSKSKYLQNSSPQTYLVLDSACNTLRIKNMQNGSVSTCGSHDVRPILLDELQNHLPHKALSSLYQSTQFKPGSQAMYHPPITPNPDPQLLKNIVSVSTPIPQNSETIKQPETIKKHVSFDNTVTEITYKGKKITKNYVKLHCTQVSTSEKHQFFPYDLSYREFAILTGKKG